jgi:hypothetical protein
MTRKFVNWNFHCVCASNASRQWLLQQLSMVEWVYRCKRQDLVGGTELVVAARVVGLESWLRIYQVTLNSRGNAGGYRQTGCEPYTGSSREVPCYAE